VLHLLLTFYVTVMVMVCIGASTSASVKLFQAKTSIVYVPGSVGFQLMANVSSVLGGMVPLMKLNDTIAPVASLTWTM